MKHKTLLLALLAAIPFLFPTNAHAGDRCKTYSKTIRVNGHIEMGYGVACQRDDGLWEIVKAVGDYLAREEVKRDIYNDVRVVVYEDDHHHKHNDYYTCEHDRYEPRYYKAQPVYYKNHGQYKKYNHSSKGNHNQH